MDLRTHLFLASLLTASLVPCSTCLAPDDKAAGNPVIQSPPVAADKSRPTPTRQSRRRLARSRTSSKDGKEPDSVQFLRIRRDQDEQPTAMETSITRFVGQNQQGADVTVDLVGAVHVG